MLLPIGAASLATTVQRNEMEAQRPIRVLVLAEKANPNWISVPRVGWDHVMALFEHTDVHLVTHVRNRDDILASGLAALDVTFVGERGLDRWAHSLALKLEGQGAMGGATQTALQVPLYYRFEASVWRRFAPRLFAKEFDVVHRITPVSPAVPSPIAARCREIRVPFVVGPLNGGVPWPPGFEDIRRQEGEWVSYLRGAHKLLPHFKATRRAASAVIVGSAVAWLEAVAVAGAQRCFYMPENAIDTAGLALTARGYGERPLRVAFVGRLVPYKGADLLVRAAAPLVQSGRVVLDIIGGGPQMASLQRLVDALGIGTGVRLAGWVPHHRLQERLTHSVVFCFPSVREFGGAVVIEAMALGLVPVVLDYGGPSEVVSPETGIRVPLGSVPALIANLRASLAYLADLPSERLAKMGARARLRALREFSLTAKAEKTQSIYEWVLGRRDVRPSLMPPAHSVALYRSPAS